MFCFVCKGLGCFSRGVFSLLSASFTGLVASEKFLEGFSFVGWFLRFSEFVRFFSGVLWLAWSAFCIFCCR